MIFSVDGSIEKIKAGTKTQTRRPTDRYQVGKDYAIQPGRTKPGIPEGRIMIIGKQEEWKKIPVDLVDSREAILEGGYTPEEFEALYQKMYPGWEKRWAYAIDYMPSEGGTS